MRRFQYTAIDDATRIRALKIYENHTQQNAIDFIDYVVAKLPFRIHTIRTDDGHEFQAKFHWHVEDLGMIHTYIKPRTPRLNGKVERSHLTDEQEFYQLLTYTDGVDLNKKLEEWENLYNPHRPHSSLGGKTPYEVLKEKLESNMGNGADQSGSIEAAPAVKTVARLLLPPMVASLEAETFCEGATDGL